MTDARAKLIRNRLPLTQSIERVTHAIADEPVTFAMWLWTEGGEPILLTNAKRDQIVSILQQYLAN